MRQSTTLDTAFCRSFSSSGCTSFSALEFFIIGSTSATTSFLLRISRVLKYSSLTWRKKNKFTGISTQAFQWEKEKEAWRNFKLCTTNYALTSQIEEQVLLLPSISMSDIYSLLLKIYTFLNRQKKKEKTELIRTIYRRNLKKLKDT